jgi:hypothetical protein
MTHRRQLAPTETKTKQIEASNSWAQTFLEAPLLASSSLDWEKQREASGTNVRDKSNDFCSSHMFTEVLAVAGHSS